jgi:hypothetical protein
MSADRAEVPAQLEEEALRGLALEWRQAFTAVNAEEVLARALQLTFPPGGVDLAQLAVANDLGAIAAMVVPLDSPARDAARQWRFADKGERGELAIVLPVAIDASRPAYAPGQLCISIARLGDSLFLDSICDLVAVPVFGGVPLSMTGLTLAVGRFASGDRGEVELYATGMAWLRAHLQRAADLEAELPAHLVAQQLDPPDHYATLILEPKAIEWRPQIAWCAFGRDAKSLIVRDSLGMATLIDGLMRRKDKLPPMPNVFGPKAGPA